MSNPIFFLENKKNILNLSSAEFTHSTVSVKAQSYSKVALETKHGGTENAK